MMDLDLGLKLDLDLVLDLVLVLALRCAMGSTQCTSSAGLVLLKARFFAKRATFYQERKNLAVRLQRLSTASAESTQEMYFCSIFCTPELMRMNTQKAVWLKRLQKLFSASKSCLASSRTYESATHRKQF